MRQELIVRVLLRPVVLTLTGILVLALAVRDVAHWPYVVVMAACLLGLFESYFGVYWFLLSPRRRTVPFGEHVQVCTLWLLNTVAALALLNVAAQMAYPGTFEWRGGSASVFDIVYLTLLTFASSGYGDVLPATAPGKALSMLTSFAGLAYATFMFTALWQRFAPDDSR